MMMRNRGWRRRRVVNVSCSLVQRRLYTQETAACLTKSFPHSTLLTPRCKRATRRRVIPTQPPPSAKVDVGTKIWKVNTSSVSCKAGDVGTKAGEVNTSSVGCKAGDVGTEAGEVGDVGAEVGEVDTSGDVGTAVGEVDTSGDVGTVINLQRKGRAARRERRRDNATRRRRSRERGDKRRRVTGGAKTLLRSSASRTDAGGLDAIVAH